MASNETSVTSEQHRERIAEPAARRQSWRALDEGEKPIRRRKQSHGVNGLLAWSEGLAIIRRAL